MISEKDKAAIKAEVDAMDIDNWPPLTGTQLDLIQRVFATVEPPRSVASESAA